MQPSKATRKVLGSLSGIIAISIASPALAQQPAGKDASSNQIEEIVVTANKRSENLQKVPIAISVVTSDSLVKSGITSQQDIAQIVPGLVIQTGLNGSQAHLRGVGTTAIPAGTENSIATYLDGVYIQSMSGSMMQLNNIDQIEVLKGPQGTLFGRNATGGVISIRTRDPKQKLGGEFGLRYGNYNTVSGQAYITTGIADNLAADFAGYFSLQGKGWGKNLFNGLDANTSDDYSVRSKWLFTPGDKDTFRLTVDYSRVTGNLQNSFSFIPGAASNYGPGAAVAAQRPDLAPYVASGALAPFAQVGQPYTSKGGFYDIDQFTHPRYRYETGGFGLTWDHDFGGVRLTSITAGRRARTIQSWSTIPVPADVFHAGWTQRDSQFSEELRLGSAANSKIPWVVGLYYLDGTAGYNPFSFGGTGQLPADTITFHAFTTTKAYAAFGQATAPLWNGAHITAGLRYSTERRGITGDTVVKLAAFTGVPPFTTGVTDTHKTFSKLTWRLAVDQQITPDILGYVSFNRGFKSGIYNTLPPGGPGALPVSPEVLDAYEVGIKGDFLDKRLRVNLSGYYYNYNNLQVTVFTTVSANIENGAKAKIYGGDLDVTGKIGSHLTVTAGANLMHSEFLSYPQALFLTPQPASAGGGTIGVPGSAKGNSLPYAPDFTFNVGAHYSVPLGDGDADVNVNYSYTDKWYAGPDNILTQNSYGLLNASANYKLPGHHLQLGVWARNLTAAKYHVFLAASANPGGYENGLVGAPRTFGISLGYKF